MGYDFVVVLRAASQPLGSSFIIFHSSFILSGMATLSTDFPDLLPAGAPAPDFFFPHFEDFFTWRTGRPPLKVSALGKPKGP